MERDTILLYGSAGPTAMQMIYEALVVRQRRQVLFLLQEEFPQNLGIRLDSEQPEESCWILPTGLLKFGEIVSVALNGYYVDASRFDDLEPEDLQYSLTESWSTLTAAFGQLSDLALLANRQKRRDQLLSRWGQLSLLSSLGLPTPRHLVSSDPDEVSRFLEASPRAVYKRVSNVFEPFRPVTAETLAQLDRVVMCPMMFEELPAEEAWHGRIAVVGSELHALPDDPGFPSAILERLRSLSAQMEFSLAEYSLRCHEGHWTVSAITPFVTPEVLSHDHVLEAVCHLLEEGKP